MRVIEPRHLQTKQKRRSNGRKLQIGAGVLVGIGVLYGLNMLAGAHVLSRVGVKSAVSEVQELPAQEPVVNHAKPKIFTGVEFKNLYRSVMRGYPNLELFSDPPEITGNQEADARIRKIAETRGFMRTGIPVTALVKTDEPLLKDTEDDLLQPLAYKGWLELEKAAEKDYVPLAMFSGYRSPERQREIFMERLLARGVTVEEVAAGLADDAVRANLSVTAVPGYSRHHTGYTADFTCEDGTGSFETSMCFRWLNKNNYLHAKQHGWIPSYPEDAGEQGPEPEAWEYVWVGKTVLFE